MHALIQLLVLLLLLFCTGCAGLQPFDPAAPSELAPNEGILVLHIDTDVAIDSIETSAGTIVESLVPDEYLVMLTVRAGNYRWDRLNRTVWGQKWHWNLWSWRLHRDESFTVEAGRLNYIGHLMIRRGPREWYLEIRPFNQSAMMLHQLERQHPDLLAKFPMRYAGPERDDFLERYQRARLKSELRSPESK